MGIIVACAPTLKRLFASLLGIGSTNRSNGYYNGPSGYGRSGQGSGFGQRKSWIPNGGRGPMSPSHTLSSRDRSGYQKTSDEIELDFRFTRNSNSVGNGPRSPRDPNMGFAANAYRARAESGSGSEDMILQGTTKDPALRKGAIVMTTEINVDRTPRN